jgi:hypothetical protein
VAGRLNQLVGDVHADEWTTTTVRSTSPIERSVTDGHNAATAGVMNPGQP